MSSSRRDHIVRELIAGCEVLGNATIADGAFAAGPAVWVGKREIAHFDPDGALDVRMTRSVIRDRRTELRADDRILLRAGSSDWLAVRIGGEDDMEFALSLVKDAVDANLPTAPPGLAPEGAELDRRRFH